jgi:hypothetical protein
MPGEPRKEPCPECGKLVSIRDEVCPYCDAELYEDEEEERRPRRSARGRKSGDVEAVDFIIPTNVSAWSILACYLGLIGFCIPFIGMVFAIPAVIFGIIALRKRRKATSYGAVTSDIRAIIGIVLGSLGIVYPLVILLIIVLNEKR